jgi:hypothetical protein
MTIQQTTPHLGLPLPHPDNELQDDVSRLRDALGEIDGMLFMLQSLVASDDVSLDTVQEIVMVLQQAQGNIGEVTTLLATKANQSYVDTQLATKANQVYVDTQLATRAVAATVAAQLAAKADAAATTAALAVCATTGANTFTAAQSVVRVDKGTVTNGTVTFNYSSSNVQRLQVGGPVTIVLAGFPPAGTFGEVMIKLVNGGSAVVTLPTIQWILPSGVTTGTLSTYFIAIGRTALQDSGIDFLYLWTDDGGGTIYGKLL